MQKTFLVAGGSTGIGYELSIMLHQLGHKVIVLSRQRHELPPYIEHIAIDFNQEEFQLPVIDEELAGIVYMPGSIQLKPFRSIKANDYINDFRLNFIGATELIKFYHNKLSKTSASIVLMSTVAVGTGIPYHSMVAASKGAVEGLTRALAAEFSPLIRVNAIAPSLTNTPLAEKLLNSEDKVQAGKERHPLKQIGQPKDIAEMIAFLLSDASQFVSGQIFHLDGGMSAIRK